MRHLVFAVASFVALAGLAVSTPSAQADQKGKKPGQGQKGKGQKGQMGQRPNPAAIAVKMIEKFDRNGDRALNAKELTAALTAMREQRGNRGGGPGQGAGKGGAGRGGKGGAGKGPGRSGKGRRPGSGK